MNVNFLYTVDQIRQTVRAPYYLCHYGTRYSKPKTHSTHGPPMSDTTIQHFNKQGRDTNEAPTKVLEIRSVKGLVFIKIFK